MWDYNLPAPKITANMTIEWFLVTKSSNQLHINFM